MIDTNYIFEKYKKIDFRSLFILQYYDLIVNIQNEMRFVKGNF